jgi:putative endonuclease
MYYVYILESRKDRLFYTGFTTNLLKRIKKHNSGLVKSTKERKPFELIYYEACLNKTDALKREKYLKTSWGKRFVKNRTREYLKKGHS